MPAHLRCCQTGARHHDEVKERAMAPRLSKLRLRRYPARRRPVRRTTFTAVTAAVALAIGVSASAAASGPAATGRYASAAGRPAYLNPHLPVPARVADLLGQMTLPEKIGQ